MALCKNVLRRVGCTQICKCVVRGTVSLPDEGDGAGELQLWHQHMRNGYYIHVSRTAGGGMVVCELLMFFISFQECTDKIETLSNKEVEISYHVRVDL